jgi:arabinogalactan endo-1,4-beta-galactosidase
VESNGVTGSFKLTHWKDTPCEVSTYQTITGLGNGT